MSEAPPWPPSTPESQRRTAVLMERRLSAARAKKPQEDPDVYPPPAVSAPADQLRQVTKLKAELQDIDRHLRDYNPDELMTSTDAAHLLRDRYHVLLHDHRAAPDDEELLQMWGDMAQAYNDTMAAVRRGDLNMPVTARRVLGLPEAAKFDLNDSADTRDA